MNCLFYNNNFDRFVFDTIYKDGETYVVLQGLCYSTDEIVDLQKIIGRL